MWWRLRIVKWLRAFSRSGRWKVGETNHSHMTTSFFMIQSRMLDTGCSRRRWSNGGRAILDTPPKVSHREMFVFIRDNHRFCVLSIAINRWMSLVSTISYTKTRSFFQWHCEKCGLRSAQKQGLEEVRDIKDHVFVQVFNKAASEKKILDSSKWFL